MGIYITPEIWGPVGWKFIHFVALAYPDKPTEEQKNNYKTFFDSIKNILPCIICSNNYKKHLEVLPLSDDVLKDRESMVNWSIDMHNMVNVENKKPALSYEDAINLIINNYDQEAVDAEKLKKDIQSNEIKSNKNIELSDKPNSKLEKNIDSNKINKKDDESNFLFFNFIFWFIILGILVAIAIIYKKN